MGKLDRETTIRNSRTVSKWIDKLTRQTDKYNPRKRKQYRKARYRKKAKRFEEFCEKEEAEAEELDRLDRR